MKEKKKEVKNILQAVERVKPVADKEINKLNQKLEARQIYIAQLTKLEKGIKLAQKERLGILRLFSNAQAQGIKLTAGHQKILKSTIKVYNDTALSTELGKEE